MTCSWCDQPEILERCPPTKPPKAGLLLPSQSFYPNSGTKEQAVITKPPGLIQGPGHTRKPTIRINHREASWSRWRVSMPTWVSARSVMLWFLWKFLWPGGYVSYGKVCVCVCVVGLATHVRISCQGMFDFLQVLIKSFPAQHRKPNAYHHLLSDVLM